MSTQTPTPAEVEAIHLAADRADNDVVSFRFYFKTLSERRNITPRELATAAVELHRLIDARTCVMHASDLIRGAEAEAKAEWASMKITR